MRRFRELRNSCVSAKATPGAQGRAQADDGRRPVLEGDAALHASTALQSLERDIAVLRAVRLDFPHNVALPGAAEQWIAEGRSRA